ncbi:GNAT family N-acetyltransferase [Candidatus Margulisiibacteriota bacterium]
MIIRQAKETDMHIIQKLAQNAKLDTDVMPSDEYLAAVENDQIIGFGRTINHPDCTEFSSLFVIKQKRNFGIGTLITKEQLKLSQKQGKAIYLATIIPVFFENIGFKKTTNYPQSMIKDSSWCEGCASPEKCTMMKYEHT